jgi:AcrR family transcriptional regulator
VLVPRVSAAQRERTYASLLDAVIALVMERGFDAVTMRDIAEHAGLARSAIYNYADDKAALLIAATVRGSTDMREAVGDVAADLSITAPERLDGVLRLILGSFSHDAQNLFVLRAVQHALSPDQREQALQPFRSEVGEHIARIVQDGAAAGEYRLEQDLRFTLELVAGVLNAALDSVVEDPDRAAAVLEITSSFLQGALRR